MNIYSAAVKTALAGDFGLPDSQAAGKKLRRLANAVAESRSRHRSKRHK